MTNGSRVMVALRVDSTPDVAFEAFTTQIGTWWRPNGLFQFSEGRTGTLAFEPGPTGRLVETYPDGSAFAVGEIRCWDPPELLVMSWREESFAADQETQLTVRFEEVGEQTRVTVEHVGWDAFPPEHAARHGIELSVFQLRLAQWWRDLLQSLKRSTVDRSPGRRPTGSAGDDESACHRIDRV
ncbi:MAG: SRPBCC domain-containing protein [Microthrixaceae bacterium]|nr:SRPBCC domain-containing protein [Microthrixaceae bacterium]